MARETIIIECTEARKEGKNPSRYMTTRNKKLPRRRLNSRSITPPSVATRCTRKSRAKPFLSL